MRVKKHLTINGTAALCAVGTKATMFATVLDEVDCMNCGSSIGSNSVELLAYCARTSNVQLARNILARCGNLPTTAAQAVTYARDNLERAIRREADLETALSQLGLKT